METTNLTSTEKVLEAELAYYRLADVLSATLLDASAWHEMVPPDIQQEIMLLVPHEWLALPNFKRYLLEKNGVFLHTYMATHLSSREFNHWLLHGYGGIREGGIL